MYTESASTYETIPKLTEQDTGLQRVGSLRLASNEARWEEFKEDLPRSLRYGIEAHLISPEEVAALAPEVRTDDLVGAMYTPSDAVSESESAHRSI